MIVQPLSNVSTKEVMLLEPKQLKALSLAVPQGSIEGYLQAINSIPMLDAEQEIALAAHYRDEEDLEAARQLVMSHLRFVAHIARSYKGYGLPLSDLIQEGNVGLMKAVKRFDHSFGVRLVSFAVHWIKAEIHEYVLRNWRIVKVATTKAQRKLFFNLRSKKQGLGWMNGDEVKLIAQELGVTEEDVLMMEQRLSVHDAAFDAPTIDDDSHGSSPVYYLEDKSSLDPAQAFVKSDTETRQSEQLQLALANLDQRSQDIVSSRWLADTKATLHELADKYGVSAERIRQLEVNAMKKMRMAIAL